MGNRGRGAGEEGNLLDLFFLKILGCIHPFSYGKSPSVFLVHFLCLCLILKHMKLSTVDLIP